MYTLWLAILLPGTYSLEIIQRNYQGAAMYIAVLLIIGKTGNNLNIGDWLNKC